MKRPFFFAVVTSRTRPQVCGGCGLEVRHREYRYRIVHGATATVWTPMEHRAPCGRLCPRGVVPGGEVEDLHQVGGCRACAQTSARPRFVS